MPIDTPCITRAPAQRVARLHVVTPRAEIKAAMSAALDEMHSVLQAQDVTPVGPWLTYHHHAPTDIFDFHVCFPVGKPIEAAGRVGNGELPAVDVLRTVYRGDYEGLSDGWREFMHWVHANGYKTEEGFFEVYAVGPKQQPDPAGWRTELHCPLTAGWQNTQRNESQ